MKRLTGKVALLAGATSGIGQRTAEIFAEEGAHVVVGGRRAREGSLVVDQITKSGGSAIYVPLDVSEPESVEAAVRTAVREFGALHVLFSNAGGSTSADGTVVSASLDEFWNKIQVDLYGAFLCSRYTIPAIIESGGGSVVNVASMAGLGTAVGRDAYSAAKGGLVALTRSTARTFVGDNVRVNAIAPAAVKTERILKLVETVPAAAEALAPQKLGLIDPAEIALAAVYLASAESARVTGQILEIHGGSFG